MMSGLSVLILVIAAFIFVASVALVARHALMILPFVVTLMYFVWARPDRDDEDLTDN